MKDIVRRYIEGLEQAYLNNGGENKWREFIKVKEGASSKNIARIKELFPDVPESLLELLEYADGTYFRKYGDITIRLYFLGSELENYPYYLLSSEEIIENKSLAQEWYSDYVNREFDPADIPVDDRIIDDASKMKWLHFSDCMNNGGSSQLFIDFSPSKSGTIGQIVMFVHDSDRIEVIANSFDEYLEKMIKWEFNFIVDEFL